MNPSLYIQGAGLSDLFGGKPKPKPAVLKPPHTGLFPNIASYSVSEVVDLISDGPIYGLVNKSGQRDTIFKGIYFNNTPVESYSKSDDDLVLSPSGTGDNVWEGWFTKSQEFFNQFWSNNQTVAGYSYAGNSKNMFAALTLEGKDSANDTDDKGRALLQFPFITSNAANLAAIGQIKRAMPFKDDIGGTNFNVISSGSYSTDLIDADLLINSSNNADLKEAAQESFYIRHDDGDFEIHYYNDESYPELGVARTGSILGDFSTMLDTLAAEYIGGSNLQKVQYAFVDKAIKRFERATNREFGVRRHLRFENDKFGGFDVWGESVEVIEPDEEIALIFKIGDSGNYKNLGRSDSLFDNIDNNTYVVVETEEDATLTSVVEQFVDPNTGGDEAVKNFSFKIQEDMGIEARDFIPLLIPELETVNDAGPPTYKSIRMTGKVFGVVVFFVKISKRKLSGRKIKDTEVYRHARSWHIQGLSKWTGGVPHNIQIIKEQSESARKFNFASVTCEFKKGTELQSPLKHFSYSSVDYEYNAPLYGPFRTLVENGSGVFRIEENVKAFSDGGGTQWSPTGWDAAEGVGATFLDTPISGSGVRRAESSEDYRGSESYSSWNDANEWNEESTPAVHIIENPETSHIGFSLIINELKDTISTDLNSTYKAGSPYPTVLHMHAEWGKIGPNGESNKSSRRFKIVGLAQSQIIIDFGAVSKEYEGIETQNSDFYDEMYSNEDGVQFVQNSNAWDRNLNNDDGWRDPATELYNPLELPTLTAQERFSGVKRFLRVYKVSAETNSVLLAKDVSLLKVTEIVKNKFRYPYSAIVGSKFDSRYFSSIPNRSFDCRLKLIQIPSNYEPLDDFGIDKRYLEDAGDTKQQIYIGDWDGTFIMGWTDNPAWILYDLLTSERYGLGNYIEKKQINIWELYKIGRFCDAVNDLGYFEGVDDLNGGLEPRYSCNIIFNENTKVFDAINIVANLFRGSVFFGNDGINFADDRPKSPIAMFNNSNVDNGVFNYTNYRRDQQYNTVEVAYLDRFDDYKTKIEYIEDAEDVRNRGVLKTIINTLGVTSQAMARRIGKHLIHQSIFENQTVEFSAGLETMLCRPGDIVRVDDEMKSRSRNFGRILEITPISTSGSYHIGEFRLDEKYDAAKYSNYINVYAATGNFSYDDMRDLAKSNRMRVDSFELDTTNEISGDYYFSGYANGYTSPSYLQSEYFAVYTGASDKLCYFNTGSGAWLFSSGGTIYGKTEVGVYDITDIRDGTGYLFNPNGSNLNVSAFSFEGYTDGITDDEISLCKNDQIARFQLESTANLTYGSNIVIKIPNEDSQKIAQYSAVEVGSVYRFENEEVASETYKILSIRENASDSYTIAASKYDTNKYNKIDNLTREEIKEEKYFNGIPSLEEETYEDLARPATFTGSKSAGTISLSWSPVIGALTYWVSVYNKENDIWKSKYVDAPSTGTSFNYNDDITSYWMAKIFVVGDKTNNADKPKRLRL